MFLIQDKPAEYFERDCAEFGETFLKDAFCIINGYPYKDVPNSFLSEPKIPTVIRKLLVPAGCALQKKVGQVDDIESFGTDTREIQPTGVELLKNIFVGDEIKAIKFSE